MKEVKWGGIGSEAVQAKTGRSWEQWIRLLDRTKADRLSHKQIAAMLHEKFGLGAWWSQMVAVGYEQAKGLRKVHETASGFVANVSRTFPAEVAVLYSWWEDDRKRKRWLMEDIVLHRKSPGKSLRITWTDGKKSVSVNFYDRGTGKSSAQLGHEKLNDAKQVAEMKKFWKEAFERLAAIIQS